MARAMKIKFGDYLNVTDEGNGVIRVDGCPPGGTEETFPPFNEAIMSLAATRDLIGYWRLGGGASPFADTSGYSGGPNNMVKTSTGTAMTDSVTGALPSADDDGAVKFNVMGAVAGDYLSAGPESIFTGHGDRTICAWIKPMGSPSGTQNVVGTQDNSNGGWSLGLSGLQVFFSSRDSGGSDTATGPAIPVDRWTFVVAEWSPGSGVRLYFDGVLVYTNAVINGIFGIDTLVIGRRNPASGGAQNAFQGAIDEVSYWADRLTAAEVATLADSGGRSEDPTVRSIINVVGAYTANTNETVLANGTFTVTLPTATGNSGAEVIVKNTGAGTITVAQAGSETIDGSTTDLTLAANDSVVLVSNGTGWYITSSYSYP